MGLIKANNYNSEEWQISVIAKAMSHPARKRIVELVLKNDYLSNSDLSDLLNLHQATVTRHLNVLYNANVLRPLYHIHFSEITIVPETLMVLDNYLKEIIKQATDLELGEKAKMETETGTDIELQVLKPQIP